MNEPPRRDLIEVYGKIFAAKSHRTRGLPPAEELEEQLHEELDALSVRSLRSRTWRLRRYTSRHWRSARRKLGSRIPS